MARPIQNLSGDLRKAMRQIQGEALVQIQSELGDEQTSPKDTGRLRSSWFASTGSPSGSVAPEGADSPNTDATQVDIDLNKPAWLSNNLDYAQSAAVAGKVTSASPTWFVDFRNSRIPRIYEQAAKTVRKQEGF